MIRLTPARGAALLALTLGTLALATPAHAVGVPPVTCNTPDFALYVEGTANAPVLLATSYYICTDGSIRPYGYAQIGRYLPDGTWQAVTEEGQPAMEYVCKGNATKYEYTGEGQTLDIACG